MKKKKKSLTSKVLFLITLVILPLNIILFWAASRMILEVDKQVKLSLQNVADVYMNTLDMKMQQSDYYLYNVYTTDADFLTFRAHKNELDYRNACVRCQYKLNQEINTARNSSVYFFYNINSDKFIVGTETGIVRSELVNYLSEVIPGIEKWSVVSMGEKDYLLRISKMSDAYYGAMIELNLLEKQISDVVGYQTTEVSFVSNNKSIPQKNVIEAVCDSERGDSSLKISVQKSEIRNNLSIFEKGMFVISLISLVLIPLMYYVMNKWILHPINELNQAHRELEVGNENYRIKQNSDIKELDSAYHSFNQMADNIHSLKIENMEKELAKNKLRLNNLQLQIRPHFLLNTFNLIFNLASDGERDNIKELVLYLSAYFRHIFRSGKELELFQKEYVLIQGYVKAAQIRYPDCIEINYQIDPEINMVRVPPLMIHNFVENIINHAFTKGKKMHIMLTAEYVNGQVSFEISDNGIGMDEAQVKKINEGIFETEDEVVHVGLLNSITRLKYFYGDEATIQVESELGVGTIFTITFPYYLEELE